MIRLSIQTSAASASREIENTGPLTRKRMETFDGEVLRERSTWMDKNGKEDKPFFAGSTRRPSTSGPTLRSEVSFRGGGRRPCRGRCRACSQCSNTMSRSASS